MTQEAADARYDLAAGNRRRAVVAGGSNQARVRAYNLRLVLSLVQRLGTASKAEIARQTGLSAQSATLIVRELERDGFLLRGEPRRGRVGQPSIPMTLNPDGAFSLGLKVGRRSTDMVLVDLTGTIRSRVRETHDFPDPDRVINFAESGFEDLTRELPPAHRDRIAGLGIAHPYHITDWSELLGVPEARTAPWRGANLVETLEARLPVKVVVENDCTAACSAEHVFGVGAGHQDFVYLYIASFIGGGIVMNGALYPGPSGNAGAFGPMPVIAAGGNVSQLLQSAALNVLERMLKDAGRPIASIWEQPDDWDDFGPELDAWVDLTARHLAYAIGSACAVIDFPAAIIDGAFPTSVRERVVERTREAIASQDMRGLTPPEVIAGKTGPVAPALGGASLPLIAEHFLDRNALTLKAG